MARLHEQLKVLEVKNLTEPGIYADGGGLYVRVGHAGNKSWVFIYILNGRRREMGLGPVHTVSLVEARDKARKYRQMLLEKIDPLDARDEQLRLDELARSNRVTFDICAERYIEDNKGEWKNPDHYRQWKNSIATYCSPHIGHMYVDEIDTPAVLKCLDPIWKTKTVTASRVRERIKLILGWAKGRGYRQGDNPAEWEGTLKEILPSPAKIKEVEHHPALPYTSMYKFMSDLKKLDGIAERLYEFTVLTAVRSGESRKAVWDEIDLEQDLWTLPKNRTKHKKEEHVVPLTKRCIEILKEMKSIHDDNPSNPYVFPGRKDQSLSRGVFDKVLSQFDVGDATTHGFRATFSTWAADLTLHHPDLVEKALSHMVGNEVKQAYQRGAMLAKRALLMKDWERYCFTKRDGNNVVGIKSKTAA